MKTIIANGIVLSPDEEIHGRQVVIEDGRIVRMAAVEPAEAGVNQIDAQGSFVIPGLIDIHVHGANSFDTMDATPDAIQGMGRFLASHGVTSYLPTTVSASQDALMAAIENAGRTPFPVDGAQHLGIHLEGPYLNSSYAGAQPVQHLRRAAREEYERWITSGQVRLITVAPEVEGVPALLDAGTEAAIEFAIGHSAATYEQVLLAIEHGLRQVTHVFNGMPPMHHRSPGVLGAALSEERLNCQIIADGIHVHPAVVKLLVRSKGVGRTILVTDAISATGLPDGAYSLGDQRVHVAAGAPRTEAGGLAGSTLTMDQALRNVMQFANLSLSAALPMATRVPAAAMGWQGRKGIIAPNADADLVIMDDRFQVRLTMVAGRVVFETP